MCPPLQNLPASTVARITLNPALLMSRRPMQNKSSKIFDFSGHNVYVGLPGPALRPGLASLLQRKNDRPQSSGSHDQDRS